MNKPGHFWCAECGCDRPYCDAVNEIINGEALCHFCHKELETNPELTEDVMEDVLVELEEELGILETNYHDTHQYSDAPAEEPQSKVAIIKTDHMTHAIADGILVDMDIDDDPDTMEEDWER